MKQLICGAIATAALFYFFGCIGGLEAGTLSTTGAVLRCGVSSVVIYGALRGI